MKISVFLDVMLCSLGSGADIVGEPAASILHWTGAEGDVFELTVQTVASGESAERSVWTQQLSLNDLPWDPALSEA